VLHSETRTAVVVLPYLQMLNVISITVVIIGITSGITSARSSPCSSIVHSYSLLAGQSFLSSSASFPSCLSSSSDDGDDEETRPRCSTGWGEL
jgi:hypothetical protein